MAPVSIQSILKCFIGRLEAEIAENGPKIYAEIRSEIPGPSRRNVQRAVDCYGISRGSFCVPEVLISLMNFKLDRMPSSEDLLRNQLR